MKEKIHSVKYNFVMIPWRLCSFVVQGFVMLSGVKLFLNGKDKLPFGKYISGRIKGVIVPYAVCFVVYYLCFALVYGYPLFDVGFIIKNFLMGNLVCHLYFIPIIFQFDLLFPIWKKLVAKCTPKIVIPIAIIFSMLAEMFLPRVLNTVFQDVNFVYNDRVFTTYLSYWLIGCYIGKNYDAFCNMLRKYFAGICIVFTISLVAVISFSYLAYNQLATIPYINLIHSFYVLAVCIFLYAVTVRIPIEFWEKAPFMNNIDRASFYIYLYHMLMVLFAQWMIDRLGICVQGGAFIIRAAIAYGVTLPGCILYQKIQKRLLKKAQ